MKTSESIAKIAPQLVKALGLIEGAAKKKVNPGFKSRYADLETVIDASKDILGDHGITIIQIPGACSGGVMNLETVLLHESGEFISGDMGIALGKTDPQGVGSALTYGRRYAQMAMLNMPAVDDDGEAAMGRGKAEAKSAPSAYQAKKDGMGPRANELIHELREIETHTEVGVWAAEKAEEIKKMPDAWRAQIREELEEHRRRISEKEMDDGFQRAVG